MAYPMHRLLELGDPSARVAVPGPVEPAILSYYLELLGVGAGNRLLIVPGDDLAPAPAAVTLGDLRAARVPIAGANAFRAGTALGVDGSWREAAGALRAQGAAWNPLARAGVILYGLETLEDTG